MNVKFTVSKEEALDFFRRFGTGCYFRFELVEGHYEVVGVDFLGDIETEVIKPSGRVLNEAAAHKPWFKSVYEIQEGWFFVCYCGAEARAVLRFYYDLDRKVFYISWYHR